MKLREAPFTAIRDGQKRYELRLYDEKRKKIRVGDTIRFVHNEEGERTLLCRVTSIAHYPTFDALYAALPLFELGYREEEIEAASPQDMECYYEKEEIATYGVIAIGLALVANNDYRK